MFISFKPKSNKLHDLGHDVVKVRRLELFVVDEKVFVSICLRLKAVGANWVWPVRGSAPCPEVFDTLLLHGLIALCLGQVADVLYDALFLHCAKLVLVKRSAVPEDEGASLYVEDTTCVLDIGEVLWVNEHPIFGLELLVVHETLLAYVVLL